MILLFLLPFIQMCISQLLCPNSGIPFDYQSCDPNVRSECPAGFTCRKSTDTSSNSSKNLCCESGSMTIQDWLTKENLYPNIFPQIPYNIIDELQLTPITTNFNFPSIHIGDEIVTLSFPNYVTATIEYLALNSSVDVGYVHVVTIIDGSYKPFAVLVNYNVPITQSTQYINVSNSQKFVAYLDNSTFLNAQDSYRSQYTVFLYYTPAQITFSGNTPQEMLLGNCADAKCMFSNSPFSAKLNQPTSGTIFYLTTKNTIFGTEGSIQRDSTNQSILPNLFVSEVISGDVGHELDYDVNSIPEYSQPSFDLAQILANIPTLPPFEFPTIDPNFWQNLPTLPPLQFPTLDPDFWKNLPTLAPIEIPTIDPDFWKNLPTLAPIEIPTIDPDFWKNLVTLAPIPTLDPNFWNNLISAIPTIDWQNLPTIAPITFPTLPPFTIPSKADTCTYKLAEKIRNDSSFANSLNYTDVQQTVNTLKTQASTLCTSTQSTKLNALIVRYSSLITSTQQIVPYLTTSQLQTFLLNILDGDSNAVNTFLFGKVIKNIGNMTISSKFSTVSGQIGLLQLDLAFNPV
ncbi:unnamed protein product [Caenorhabditis angaria]|uniref:Uncharacterized protein n=1 Tax=Caenorhabditis angaria TaxID=860376 RepID=A0A9P1IKN8_9PELO|nr:unnamed protein product [Caenorhabditis angaria]